ncbi:MAG: precorrin-6x reductase [Spirochaetes bacterium GWF1_41_5]|nr:MAG: precorrin-6x reductase [Spirochaetes bacterium GWF1_41_5]
MKKKSMTEKPLLFFIGGTGETAPLCSSLAEHGYRLLVSTATDEPLSLPDIPDITRRTGRLDLASMTDLIRQSRSSAVICAAHPYASRVRETAIAAGSALGLPCLIYDRPGTDVANLRRMQKQEADSNKLTGIMWVESHEQAAAFIGRARGAVLITTGANNLDVYACEARRTGVRIAVRILPRAESITKARKAGIADENIISQKGPFTEKETLEHIRRFNADLLITKESGTAGGFTEKIHAARRAGIPVVVIRRPRDSFPQNVRITQFFDEVIEWITRTLAVK